nr:suppressor of fused domain protein [Pirellula staleyi]
MLRAAGCQMPHEEDVALDLSIPKEEPAAVSAETSEFSDADREAIIQAIAGEFGPVEPHALQEIVPVDAEVEVRVHVIPAGEESPFLTIFTTGMSARPMTVPEGSEAFEYAELLMHLPGDWKWKESLQEDSPYSWPFQWLRNIAYLPHLNATWLGGPHTIIASDDPPVPLGAGTDFTCLLLVADLIDCAPIELPSGRSVRVYTVVPIFTDERDLELREGVVALLKKFQKYFIPSVCLPGRPSVASMGT